MPESLSILSDGLKLDAALFLPRGGLAPYPALVICHGMPTGAPPDPADPGYPGLAQSFADTGIAALIFNFRGAGRSEGDFDIGGWDRDLNAVLDYLRARREVDARRVAVMGFSAGGAVAICVTARRPDVAALVACAAPAGSMRRDDPQEAVRRFREIGIIRDPAFPSDVDAWARAYDANAAIDFVAGVPPRPFLIIHGTADDVVPYVDAGRLLAAAQSRAEFFPVAGGTHRLRHDERAMAKAREWLKEKLVP